jgi:uncharacterized protein with ATP-grasp and redox domains
LWGNRADLSNFTIREGARVGLDTIEEAGNILIDDTARTKALLQEGVEEVAFVNDNVGADSLFDLVLSDFLLQQGWAQRVTFHLKDRPFFVSDAMPADIELTLAHLVASPYTTSLGQRLQQAETEGRLILRSHPFWTSWRSFWDMPAAVHDDLAAADLVVLKGDVNYRRLLDDRHWPHTVRLAAAADAGTRAFPRPFLVLRTLKGEILVGLEPGQAEAIEAEDPTWLINGKRGLVQLVR